MSQPARTPARWFTRRPNWVLSLGLAAGLGLFVAACGDEEETPAPAPTPAPTPAPPPAPAPEPDPEPDPEPEGLAVPSGLAATSGAGSITWTWNAVSGVTSYYVEYSLGAAFSPGGNFTIVTTPSFTLSNQSNGAVAHLRVRSRAGTAQSPEYSEYTEPVRGTAAAPPATALDTPTGLATSNAGEDSIDLSWSEVDDADTYEVQQRIAGGAWTDADCGDDNSVDENECEATGLSGGTEYAFRVRAVPDADDDSLTNSAWSASATGTTLRSTGPSPVMGSGSLNITWRSNAASITWRWDQAGADVDYQTKIVTGALDATMPCEDRSGAWTPAGIGLSTSHTEGSLSGGNTARALCVRATWFNANGVRQYGEPSWAWAANQPADPRLANPASTPDEGVTESLSWTVTMASVSEVDYEFRYLVDPQGDTTTVTPSVAACERAPTGEVLTPSGVMLTTFTTDATLTPNTAYHLCYRAQNESGRSDWAVAVDAPVPVYTRPGRVTVGSASVMSGTSASPVLLWTVTRPSGGPNVPPNDDIGDSFDIFYVTTTTVNGAETRADVDDVISVCEGNTETGLSSATPITSLARQPSSSTQSFRVTSDAFTRPVSTAPNRFIYLCARAKNGSSEGRGPGPWTVSSPYTLVKASS